MKAAEAPLDSPAVSDQETELPRMSFLEHLEELRRRLIVSIIALIAAFLICWNFAEAIFHLLELPILRHLAEGERLAYTRVAAPFFLYMKVAFFAGLFAASPVILWQLWLFISPGLYRRERRYALPFIVFASLFFIGGGLFGYLTVLPMAAGFFIEMGRGFQQVITVDDYFSFASKLILGMGLVFETPILVFFLSRIGIVTPAFLIQKFKYAVVLIFIIAAIITPTPDIVTQSALAVPMILLYALGIGISYLFGRKVE
ncbi:MAG TPA: twin-arginine translocase subunit TatC [Thermoanaerobaculia bacterium]|nr:twin-arginine translocase subunit TatC [Thermoanaerobaculia bacterium]